MALVGISGYINSGKDTLGMMLQALTMKIEYPGKIHATAWGDDPIGYAREYAGRPNHKGGWGIRKFAGKLKLLVASILNVPIERLEDQEFKKEILDRSWSKGTILEDTPERYSAIIHNMDVRQLLQETASTLRDHVHQNYWVNALFADYIPTVEHYKGNIAIHATGSAINYIYPNWIITDVRFPNEARAIKERGGIIVRVNRPFVRIEGQGKQRVARHSSETALDNWEFDYIANNEGTLEELLVDAQYILNVILKGKI